MAEEKKVRISKPGYFTFTIQYLEICDLVIHVNDFSSVLYFTLHHRKTFNLGLNSVNLCKLKNETYLLFDLV